MGHNNSISSLMVVVTIAFFIPILLHKMKLKLIPVVVAEILAGIILGKSGFDVIEQNNWLELLSKFGFIYLMFLSGLEIDFSFFDKKKKKNENINPLKISLIVFGGILLISWLLSYFLSIIGLIKEPMFMTLLISTISLGVVVPVLKEKGIIENVYGQTILLIAVISDFATMILLAFYVMLQSKNVTSMFYLLIFFVLVFLVYRIIKRYIKVLWIDNLLKGTTQLGTRAVFALIILFVSLSETVGTESILGAFLAGMIVSLLSPKKEFMHQLESFGYGFLIPIFFVMIGVKLEIWGLFKEPKITMLMPILLIILYISKIIPMFIIKKWFTWKETFGSAFLLTSTLSLVIAASEIGYNMGIIDEKFKSALILVAIVTCLISPLMFNKILPKTKEKSKRLNIVGANNITLPTLIDFKNENYEVKIFTSKESKINLDEYSNLQRHELPLTEINEITIDELEKNKVFEADCVVLATINDEKNIALAKHANNLGVERVIVRIENSKLHREIINEDIAIFSTMFATKTLLKVLVNQPSLMHLMNTKNECLQEIKMNNKDYEGVKLKKLPFMGNALIVQIYRSEEIIIPHGETEIHLNDILLISGNKESIGKIKEELE